jgi:hypothetical protein
MADTPPAAGDPPAEPPPGAPPDAPPAGEPPPEPPADPLEPVDGDTPDVAQLRREAGNYRRQLRETEAERDRLRERLDGLERGQVEQIAAGLGATVPADVWLLITDLAELRTDAGVLDADRARQRISAILAERPSWRKPQPDYGSGARGANGPARSLGLYDLVNERRHGR